MFFFQNLTAELFLLESPDDSYFPKSGGSTFLKTVGSHFSEICRNKITAYILFGNTFSRTMHHTSSQKGLRSGWQSGAMVAAWKRLPSARKLFYFFKDAILRYSPEVTRDIVFCFNIIYFRLVWYDMPLHIPFTILLNSNPLIEDSLDLIYMDR